jgi:predicted enzyme related to lactoylglutathione lyase
MRVSHVNWFWAHSSPPKSGRMMLMWRKEAGRPTKGGGLFLYIKVDDVEDFYKAVIAWGGRPSSEPRKMPTGNREVVLRDPDGYKFVFFAEK